MKSSSAQSGPGLIRSRGEAQKIAADLRRLLAGDVEFDEVSRALYATDAGLNQVTPLGVVSPRDTGDVVRLVEYAASRGLPLVPRGMGSGLAGGAVGAGIQVDFTRYMDRILEIGPGAEWVRVQPGLVLAVLNRALRAQGRFFAPDPSSENYCSLGGMIGTNSSGARTVAYGGTIDHVLALEVVLADGSILRPRSLPSKSDALSGLLRETGLAGRALAGLLPSLELHASLIAAQMPNVVKNCSGYRVETLLAPGTVHLQRLFVGAEGTLGLVTEATLDLSPLPICRGIVMAYFPSVFASGEAVPGILALGPTAVEIMDSRFLEVVRRHDAAVDAMLPDDTDTALLIEFEGRDQVELEEKFAALERHLAGSGALQMVRPTDARETERLWTVRKSAVALALRLPGPRRALPFIEDVTVHPSEVPAYVHFLQGLFEREGVDAFMYGHVGDGNIHTRPLLDPKDSADIRLMERLYAEVTEYVLGIGGTMSGEHGDGLLRTPHIRRMYGGELYDLFVDIKDAFDPRGILNPGKKVGPQDDTGSLSRALRYGSHYRTLPQRTILAFREGDYEREIEKCHGCAQCKSPIVGTMCPVYKATGREAASPRAKANLLRHLISGRLEEDTYASRTFKAVADHCILCGMCAVECPSRVDIPRLMLEAKSRYRAQHRGVPPEALLARAEAVAGLGSLLAPLANRLAANPALRRATEHSLGIDRRRPIPPFSGPRASLDRGRRPNGQDGPLVVYFHDLYARYNDPELARATMAVLEAHGLQVCVPPQSASGVPEMLYGYAGAATRLAKRNVAALAPFVRGGAIVVSGEPTAVWALRVLYPDYLAGDHAPPVGKARPAAAAAEAPAAVAASAAVRRAAAEPAAAAAAPAAVATLAALVAGATEDLGALLLRYRSGQPERSPQASALPGRSSPLRVAYHLPCHLKAQEMGSPALTLLREIPGVEVVDLDAGCCGMAGTFGMKAGTYDLSLDIGRPLFERVAEVAPDVMASECSTCRLQLMHATGVETVHPVILLARSYAAADREGPA